MKLNIVKNNILLFIFIFNCFGQNAFAQKNDTHVTIKKGLNDDFITLSANGSEVRLECSEWQCIQASCKKWKCEGNPWHVSGGLKLQSDPFTFNSDGTIAVRCYKYGCKNDYPYGFTIHPDNNCEGSGECGEEKPDWGDWGKCKLRKGAGRLVMKANKVCVDGYYTCDVQKCIAWKVPGDKVLSLIPDIGISSIDPNLIEY